jgi:hypothetical protein
MDEMRTRDSDQHEQEEHDTEATEVKEALSTPHVSGEYPALGQGPTSWPGGDSPAMTRLRGLMQALPSGQL